MSFGPAPSPATDDRGIVYHDKIREVIEIAAVVVILRKGSEQFEYCVGIIGIRVVRVVIIVLLLLLLLLLSGSDGRRRRHRGRQCKRCSRSKEQSDRNKCQKKRAEIQSHGWQRGVVISGGDGIRLDAIIVAFRRDWCGDHRRLVRWKRSFILINLALFKART